MAKRWSVAEPVLVAESIKLRRWTISDNAQGGEPEPHRRLGVGAVDLGIGTQRQTRFAFVNRASQRRSASQAGEKDRPEEGTTSVVTLESLDDFTGGKGRTGRKRHFGSVFGKFGRFHE
jgi:hypothetical protein